MPANRPPAIEWSLLFQCISDGLFFRLSQGHVLLVRFIGSEICAHLLHNRVLAFQRRKVHFCTTFWQDGTLLLFEEVKPEFVKM
jgi:hypothetical protein